MRFFNISLFILVISLLACGHSDHGSEDIESSKTQIEYDSLVWSDEFDEAGALDTSKWFQQTKLPSWGEWFGGLINHYTDRDENAHVKDG